MEISDRPEPKPRVVLARNPGLSVTIEVLREEGHEILACGVLIRVGDFVADTSACFEGYPLRQFHRELSRCYRTLTGSASLEEMENMLTLDVVMGSMGEAFVSGVARSYDPHVSFEFQFELDQTYLPPICRQLEEVLELVGGIDTTQQEPALRRTLYVP